MAIDREPRQRDFRRAVHQGNCTANSSPLSSRSITATNVFRTNFKSALLRQYEKFSRFLRNEFLSNNLNDFGLRKGLDHLDEVPKKFQTITDRFEGLKAQCLNVRVDFPLLQKIARP